MKCLNLMISQTLLLFNWYDIDEIHFEQINISVHKICAKPSHMDYVFFVTFDNVCLQYGFFSCNFIFLYVFSQFLYF